MGVYRFEDLRVWQAARVQCRRTSRLTGQVPLSRDRGLCDQLNDASVSVMNNIAEGFTRRRDGEALQFLRYAQASNGEVRSCLHAAHERGLLKRRELNDLVEQSNIIGRMLTRFMQGYSRPRRENGGPAAAEDGHASDEQAESERTKDQDQRQGTKDQS